jgi:hypothetical protein
MAPLFTHPLPSAASITQGLPTVIDLLALPAAGTSGITLRLRLGPISRPGGCRSSVVEHSLGKGEVVGSIPTGSTSLKGAEMLVLRGFLPNDGRPKCNAVAWRRRYNARAGERS